MVWAPPGRPCGASGYVNNKMKWNKRAPYANKKSKKKQPGGPKWHPKSPKGGAKDDVGCKKTCFPQQIYQTNWKNERLSGKAWKKDSKANKSATQLKKNERHDGKVQTNMQFYQKVIQKGYQRIPKVIPKSIIFGKKHKTNQKQKLSLSGCLFGSILYCFWDAVPLKNDGFP